MVRTPQDVLMTAQNGSVRQREATQAGICDGGTRVRIAAAGEPLLKAQEKMIETPSTRGRTVFMLLSERREARVDTGWCASDDIDAA